MLLDEQRRDGFLVPTFGVDRVWRGSVSKRVVLYQPVPRPGGPHLASGGLRPFEMGQPFIVLAHLLTAQERVEFGVNPADSQSLATSMCGDGSRAFATAEYFDEAKELGPGREPQ
jgi:hypothetical protein